MYTINSHPLYICQDLCIIYMCIFSAAIGRPVVRICSSRWRRSLPATFQGCRESSGNVAIGAIRERPPHFWNLRDRYCAPSVVSQQNLNAPWCLHMVKIGRIAWRFRIFSALAADFKKKLSPAKIYFPAH